MSTAPIVRNQADITRFNQSVALPFQLRLKDFELAMQDVYDFFYDVNVLLTSKGLQRLDDMLRPAIMSGLLSDMLTASLAKHSRTLVQNRHFNGHPDLLVQGIYPNDSIPSGTEGVEIKTTRKAGGAVDTHGAREQWMCVFVYDIDIDTQPAINRKPMSFTEVYLGRVTIADFRRNPRGELGTRTATLDRNGISKLRQSWVYLLNPRGDAAFAGAEDPARSG
jgi:hypothetical protein